MKSLFSQKSGPSSFLPEDYVASKAESRANFITLTLFAVVMFLVVSAFFVNNRRWVAIHGEQLTINEQYASEKKKIEQLESLDKERAKMLAKAEVTTALLEKIPRSVLVAELVTKLPENMTVEEVALVSKRIDPAKEAGASGSSSGTQKAPPPPPSDGKVKTLAPTAKKLAAPNPADAKPEVKAPRFESTLKITGISTVYNDITDYAAALQLCPLLEKVELVYIKESKAKEAAFHRFEIAATLRSNADARSLTRPDQLAEFLQ